MTQAAASGVRATASQIRQWKRQLAKNADDVETRARLLGSTLLASGKSARDLKREHALWFIAHHPGDQLAGTPFAHLVPLLDAAGARLARNLWARHVLTTRDAKVVLNAARIMHTAKARTRLLRRACTLAPKSADVWQRLGQELLRQSRAAHGHRRRALARASVTALKRAAAHTADARSRWYLMDELSDAAFVAGQFSVAEGFARKALNGAKRWHDWNRGNAIHHGHVQLGLIALERGDVRGARQHLLRAGQSPASPQLCSYGPDCALAQALLARGERNAVTRFLTDCGRVWELDRGLLAEWKLAVERGESVEFDTRKALQRQ